MSAVPWPEDETGEYESIRCRCRFVLRRSDGPPLRFTLNHVTFGRSGDRIVFIGGHVIGLGFEDAYDAGSRFAKRAGLDLDRLENWRERMIVNGNGTSAYDRSIHIDRTSVNLRMPGLRWVDGAREFAYQISIDWRLPL